MPFKVGKYAGVGEKIRALAVLASMAGIRQAFLDSLTSMYQRLQNEPLSWGDPLFRLHGQGGMVYHALPNPIAVHYSVHEAENTVLVIDIEPLFEWPIRP